MSNNTKNNGAKKNNNKNNNGKQNNGNQFDPSLMFLEEDALVDALLQGDRASAMMYIYETAGVNNVNSEGLTPLTALFIKGSMLPYDVMPMEKQEEMLDLLLDYGADPNMPDAHGNIPIITALISDFPTALSFYQNDNVDIHQRGILNTHLLMIAAGMGLEEIIQFMSGDFDLNEKDDLGNTTLHHAVLANRGMYTRMEQVHPANMVERLCSLGADSTIANNEGKTPLDIAYEFKAYDVALALKRCFYPAEQSIRIRIQITEGEEPMIFYVYGRDTVEDIKKSIFSDNYVNFDFYFKRFYNESKRIMENERELSDYGIKQDDIIKVIPKIRAGLKGGKRKTRKHRKN